MSALPAVSVPVRSILAPYIGNNWGNDMPQVYRDHPAHNWHGGEDHSKPVRVLTCNVPIGCGAQLTVSTAPGKAELVVVSPGWVTDPRPAYNQQPYWRTDCAAEPEEVDPFVSVEVLGTYYHKEIEIPDPTWHAYHGHGGQRRMLKKIDSYGDTYNHHTRNPIPGIPASRWSTPPGTTDMARWPHQVDWRTGPFMARLPNRRNSFLSLDTEHHIQDFTSLAFSLSVSAIWDWDIPVARVRMSRWAALQAWRGYQAAQGGERFSLEQLVWDGWELPAMWIRCGGPMMPHAWLGGVPIRTTLDSEVEKAGLAWLVTSDFPAEYPVYQRVLWTEPPVTDPDLPHLEAILEDYQKQNQTPQNKEGGVQP